MSIVCPKCQYQRQASDVSVHVGICPQCGIAYAKYRAPDSDGSSHAKQNQSETTYTVEPDLSVWQRFMSIITYIPEQTALEIFWGKLALFAVFVLWGGSFIIGGVDWESIGGSFMHNINLPFHEFGHVLFGLFGRFMGILGGSLFQVLFPLVFVVAFSVYKRDNFAASICLWWCGQSFIDISPYIADAKYRAIPLILGLGEEAHDWGNLLTMTNSLDRAIAIANTSFVLGCGIMLLSFGWGGWILWRQYQRKSLYR
jgi:hypothetical protein